MMNKLTVFVMGVVCLLFTHAAFAVQSGTALLNQSVIECQRYLADDGFENIQIKIGEENSIWIYYENRRFRNEVTALAVVLQYAGASIPNAEKFIIIPRHRSVDLCFITVNPQTYRDFLNDFISTSEFIDHLKISYRSPGRPLTGYQTPSTRSSLFNFDFILQPGFKTQFARPGDPAQMQFNFLTDFSTMIAPGTQFSGQWIFPLYNEFETRENRSRPGYFHLNQFFRLPSAFFVSLSAGVFEHSFSGISAHIQRYFFRNRFSISGRFDYLNLLNSELMGTNIIDNQISYLLQTHYLLENIDFRASLTWGRYALGDQGWRIDFTRTFRELELGFMGVWNESLGFLTGLHVKIPFFVDRYAPPAKFRVRGPNHLRWKYRYLPCFDGLIIETGMEYTEVLRQFSKSYIRANAAQLVSGRRYARLNDDKRENKLASRDEK